MPDYLAINSIYETSTWNAKTYYNSMSSDFIVPSDMSLVS
ncbi:hypothetical protein F383_32712 [Gossypium arboreum]|uniref:Uncharacterized protein n=1 Tax=Gossypium arboreum TaxID=29729 RepID=A0A0B0PM53_GOSAR|nr:hypothetical protein F383_32712 [Gossypium arboreum]